MTKTVDQPPAPQRARQIRGAIWVALALVVVACIVGFLVISGNGKNDEVPASSTAQVIRDDSHRLTNPAVEKAQLVEFLDFECEACRGAIPLVDDLKAEYGDRITFAHRYYPLPGHRNSGTSALAAEAAAQQGKYEAMVDKLYATQPEWGESSDSKAALFRTYAQELGLDMAAFDAAVGSTQTLDRVNQDVADGKALGVSGTPTFFLDGKKLTLNTEAQFRQLLDAAVAD